ncbi:MAG: hypothetical protein K6G18_10530 [Treponema sp.]|nr:hypothetical protein [Treponema sp.]
MTQSVLQFARKLMRRRKFSRVIHLLESEKKHYNGSYEYYLALGTSCLYVGDYGNAWNYYEDARKIKPQGTELYLGQAVLLLRRNEIERAVNYYLDIQSKNPNNAIAAEALEFIRKATNGNSDSYDIISAYFDSGKIERFYPPLGINPDLVRNCVLVGLLLGLCISAGFVIGYFRSRPKVAKPVDPKVQFLEDMQLTEGERLSPSQGGYYRPVAVPGQGMDATVPQDGAADGQSAMPEAVTQLSDAEIKSSYDKALELVLKERDNAAHVELNRVLRSNATQSIKAKANDLLSSLYKVQPAFGTLKDNFSYLQVVQDPGLYDGCYVEWKGRIANPVQAEDGSITFDLLEGYDTKIVLEGIVRVYIPEERTRQSIDGTMVYMMKLDTEKPVRILGRVTQVGDSFMLYGMSVNQPAKGDSLEELSGR